MFDAILKTTNSSFQKGMAFCRNIYVKKVMKLLAFTGGVQYVMKTAQYIPMFYINTLYNNFP